MDDLTFIGLIFGIFLLETGIIYAYQIKHTPITGGYTYLSVATGFNLIFAGLMLFMMLYSAGGIVDLVTVKVIILVCVVILAALGGPMFITQMMKKRESDNKIDQINSTGEFNK